MLQVSDRGEYANDPAGGHVTGYDTEAPPWAQTAEVAWSAIMERPYMTGGSHRAHLTHHCMRALSSRLAVHCVWCRYMSGGFTWTGWDYKGEPTPYVMLLSRGFFRI